MTSRSFDLGTLPAHWARAGQGEAYWFDESLRIIHLDARHHGLTAVEAWIPVGFTPMLHRHEAERDTQMILEGEADFFVEGSRFVARAGDYVSIPPGAPHSFLVLRGPYRAVGLFTTSHFADLVRVLGTPATTLDLPPEHLDTRVRAEDIERARQAWAQRGEALVLDQTILGPSPYRSAT